MRRLIPYLKAYRFQILFSLFLVAFVSVLVGLTPYIEGTIITSLSNSIKNKTKIDYRYIRNTIILLCSLYFIVAISRFFFNATLTNAIQRSVQKLRNDVQQKIHRLPIRYFDNNLVGTTINIMSNDIENVSNALQQSLASVIYSLSSILIIIIMMFVINLRLALIGVIIAPFSYITGRLLLKKSKELFVRRFEAFAKLTGYLQEKYTGHREISLYNRQESIKQEFKEKNEVLADYVFSSNFISGLLLPILQGLTYAIIVTVIIVGAKLTIEEVIEIGMLQAFIRYITRLNNPISQLSQLSVMLQIMTTTSARVFNFLDEEEEIEDKHDALMLNQVEGKVEFENVNFSYTEDKIILKHISFVANPGQMIAIVGPTGSGKTTLINLLMRFYDVSSGSIKIDGIDIRDIKKDELRKAFGMVLQDTWLFNGSIKDNIKYGKPSATDEEVYLATKEASIDHFILTQPQGYDMWINEEADNISRGEKQLLTISRTFLADPNILILDEATSTVDTRLEKMLQEAMKELLKNRTSFVIAHRLSTIINADMILVLKDGEIIESGTHHQLIDAHGFYEKLYNSQFNED